MMIKMLHTKFRENRPAGYGEEDFWRVFTIYGRGGHLRHVTQMSQTKYRSPLPKEAPHMIWLWSAKRFLRRRSLSIVDDGRTDGRRRRRTPDHMYTISSPMCLRLRWANNQSALSQAFCKKNGETSSIQLFFMRQKIRRTCACCD